MKKYPGKTVIPIHEFLKAAALPPGSYAYAWEYAWAAHIDKLCKKVASAIGALKCIRSFITIEVYRHGFDIIPSAYLTSF